MFVSVQSFSRQLYNHNTDISQLRHHSQLLTQSTVSDMVSVDVKELVDTWNKLVAETSDREVRLSPTVSHCMSVLRQTQRRRVVLPHDAILASAVCATARCTSVRHKLVLPGNG